MKFSSLSIFTRALRAGKIVKDRPLVIDSEQGDAAPTRHSQPVSDFPERPDQPEFREDGHYVIGRGSLPLRIKTP